MEKPLLERHLRAGSRRYQIEVRQTERGEPYLFVEELRGDGSGADSRAIRVFPDHAPAFAEVLRQAFGLLRPDIWRSPEDPAR